MMMMMVEMKHEIFRFCKMENGMSSGVIVGVVMSIFFKMFWMCIIRC